MQEPLELRGEWWVPDWEDRWPGTLSYEPGQGVELTLSSAVGSQRIPTGQHIPVIQGEVVNGQAVTLFDVSSVQTMIHLPGGSEARLQPAHALIGAWVTSDAEPDFASFRIRLEALDEWVNQTGFDLTARSDEGFDISYRLPSEVELARVDGFTIRLKFSASRKPAGIPPTRLDLSQQARIEIVADSPGAFSDFHRLVQKLRDFYMLATRGRVRLLSIGASALGEDDGDEIEVEVLDRYLGRSEPPRGEIRPDRMLFDLSENGSGRESRMSHWLNEYELLEPVFDLVLVSRLQPELSLELQFLSLAQAAESLHSRRFDAKATPTAEHRVRVRAVVDAAPVDVREWARDRLAPANRKSFRNAFDELVDSLPPGIGAAIRDRNAVAEKVRVTRNYLTHWNPELKEDAAADGELLGLVMVLRSVLEALLLLELGFSVSEVEKLAENRAFMADLNYGTELLLPDESA